MAKAVFCALKDNFFAFEAASFCFFAFWKHFNKFSATRLEKAAVKIYFAAVSFDGRLV